MGRQTNTVYKSRSTDVHCLYEQVVK